jgi:hypothetical protein
MQRIAIILTFSVPCCCCLHHLGLFVGRGGGPFEAKLLLMLGVRGTAGAAALLATLPPALVLLLVMGRGELEQKSCPEARLPADATGALRLLPAALPPGAAALLLPAPVPLSGGLARPLLLLLVAGVLLLPSRRTVAPAPADRSNLCRLAR